MNIDFKLLIYDGSRYYKGDPGIFIADYADLLGWTDERDEVFWTKVNEHYNSKLRLQLSIDVVPNATVRELEKKIAERIGFDLARFQAFPKKSCFRANGILICIDDLSIPQSAITEYYEDNDTICYFFIFSNQAGTIWNEDGLRYTMNSREKGKHNVPHIHVDYKHEKSATICLYDGHVLDGCLPSQKLKVAREKIEENKMFLLKWWNEKTDGLKVDLNAYLGAIPLED